MYDREASPRVVAPKQATSEGDTGALDRFWDGIEREGAPIVELMPGEDQHSLMTFLWRGVDDTTNVLVLVASDPRQTSWSSSKGPTRGITYRYATTHGHLSQRAIPCRDAALCTETLHTQEKL